MKNTIIKVIILALCALLCASTLASCNNDQADTSDSSTDTTSSDGSSSDEDEVKRFDYFGADMSEYISIPSDFYKSLTVSLENNYTASDEDVQSYIDQKLFDARTPVGEGERTTSVAMKRGDTAYIFYKGMMDGKEFEGGSNMDDETPYGLALGSGSFIPGFEEGLIGVIPKDTSMEEMYEIDVTFPESYGNSEYAGKDATFYVYVAYSVQYEIPELSEKLITDTFKFKTDSNDVVAAFKKYVKDTIQDEYDEERKSEISYLAWEQLIESCEVKKYPEGEVDHYYDQELEGFEYYYQQYQYMGYTFESFDVFAREYMGLEKDADWKTALREDCQKRVSMFLICHGIATIEGITVTEEAYNEQLDYYVDYYSGQGYSAEYIESMIGEYDLKEAALNSLVIEDIVLANTTVKELESK